MTIWSGPYDYIEARTFPPCLKTGTGYLLTYVLLTYLLTYSLTYYTILYYTILTHGNYMPICPFAHIPYAQVLMWQYAHMPRPYCPYSPYARPYCPNAQIIMYTGGAWLLRFRNFWVSWSFRVNYLRIRQYAIVHKLEVGGRGGSP